MTIRIKAFFLSVIFTGNFLVVCHCSAGATSLMDSAVRHGHCFCGEKSTSCGNKKRPCGDQRKCPGTQAVKFNLLEKKAAAAVRMSPAAVIVPPDCYSPVVEGRVMQPRFSSFYLSPHAPPDRLAFYHCYLI